MPARRSVAFAIRFDGSGDRFRGPAEVICAGPRGPDLADLRYDGPTGDRCEHLDREVAKLAWTQDGIMTKLNKLSAEFQRFAPQGVGRAGLLRNKARHVGQVLMGIGPQAQAH